MPDSPVRVTLGEMASRVQTAGDDASRAEAVEQLARVTQTSEQIEAIAERFLTLEPKFRLHFLEWAARVRTPLPPGVVSQVRLLLADRALPIPVRVLAAAKALQSLPDERAAVRSIVKPLTSGLSPLRKLERMRQLQHQLEKHRALDALIDRREMRVKMDCPRCGQRLTREMMVRHLWHEHGLFLERGKIRSPGRTVEELEAEHASTHDTTVLDRTSVLAGESSLREWVAASDAPAEDLEPLLKSAETHGAGLCPACFEELPAAVPPLPLPLAAARGRVAGDGYRIEVAGADWVRTLTVSTPRNVLHSGPDGQHSFGTRGIAALIAGIGFFLALMIALFGPAEWATPGVIFRFLLLSALGYALVWLARGKAPRATDRAVDAAWNHLGRKMAQANPPHSAWLTRLARTSHGLGDSISRAGILHGIIQRVESGTAVEDLQLLAAATVLQVVDGARHGQDRVAGIAVLVAEGFRGAKPIEYSEYVAECFLNAEPALEAGDRARLRVLLLGAAFDAGLNPRELIDLWNVAPQLRRAMIVEPLHRLAMFQGIWRMRPGRHWERIARADCVFDLCRLAPNLSGRILEEYPDLLIYHRPDPGTEQQLGAILICARGVALGGKMVADAEAPIRIDKNNRLGGRYELTFGPHRFPLEHKPAGGLVETLRDWLRFRVWALLPLFDNYLAPGHPEIGRRVIRPFEKRCPRCGVRSAVSSGKIGRVI